MIVSYECLVGKDLGPIESLRISNFLSRFNGVDAIEPSKIPCVWDNIVNYERIELDDDGQVSTKRENWKVFVICKMITKQESINESIRKRNR